MKTKVKIRNNRGRVIARITESGAVNEGVNSLIYSQESGSLVITHYGEMLSVSGSVRGDLTINGQVNPSGIRTGGSLTVNG